MKRSEKAKAGPKFRVRGPSRQIWNEEIPVGSEVAAWQDALDFIALVKAERLHSFRIQVNFKSESGQRQRKGKG